VILQIHWEQPEKLSTLNDSFFIDELSSMMFDFIMSGNYKNYYNNHVVIEIHKNIARLFNKNTDQYIGVGFFKSKDDNTTD
jgi:hypothetical protein